MAYWFSGLGNRMKNILLFLVYFAVVLLSVILVVLYKLLQCCGLGGRFRHSFNLVSRTLRRFHRFMEERRRREMVADEERQVGDNQTDDGNFSEGESETGVDHV
jgi:hypothetical protein